MAGSASFLLEVLVAIGAELVRSAALVVWSGLARRSWQSTSSSRSSAECVLRSLKLGTCQRCTAVRGEGGGAGVSAAACLRAGGAGWTLRYLIIPPPAPSPPPLQACNTMAARAVWGPIPPSRRRRLPRARQQLGAHTHVVQALFREGGQGREGEVEGGEGGRQRRAALPLRVHQDGGVSMWGRTALALQSAAHPRTLATPTVWWRCASAYMPTRSLRPMVAMVREPSLGDRGCRGGSLLSESEL